TNMMAFRPSGGCSSPVGATISVGDQRVAPAVSRTCQGCQDGDKGRSRGFTRRRDRKPDDQDREPPTRGCGASGPTPWAAQRYRSEMIELPTGTTTFLLSDIEGSTRLWESEAEAMSQAMDRHDAVIEGHVASRGGAVIKDRGEGDSRFA